MCDTQEAPLRLPGPEFSAELLRNVSSESDFIRHIEDNLGYFFESEDNAELFVAFAKKTGLLEASNRFFRSAALTELTLVQTLKYPFVFNRVLSGLSGEDEANILGIPHALEAYDDIECALRLAAQGHYKQSLQILRSALELSVCHAYFSAAGLQYDDLPLTHIPPIKDKRRGMINRLLACRRIEKEVAEAISSIYNQLSLATHSHYKYLNLKFEEEDEAKKLLCVLSNSCAVSRLCAEAALSGKSISMYTSTQLQ